MTAGRRAEEVSSVLDFYHSDFTTYLATVISLTETLPEQINNQIRDAVTHLARANIADTLTEVQHQSRLARSHIERANRDCLKASIIAARVELDDLVQDVVFYHGFLTPAIKASYDDIRQLRKAAYQAETRGDDDQVAKLDEILRLTMALSGEVRAHYSVAGAKRTKLHRLFKRWFRPLAFVVTLLVGTAIGIVARGIAERVITDAEKSWMAPGAARPVPGH